MAEQDQAGATAPATAQPTGQPSIPEGQVLVSKEELSRLQQNASRVSGMQAYYEAGKARGFVKPEDFAKAEEDDDTPPQRGKRDATPDIAPIVAQEVSKTLAMERHKTSIQGQEALIDKVTTSLLGKNATEADRYTMRLAVKARFSEESTSDDNLYPDGHPLRETHFQPIGQERADKILADMKARFDKSAAQAKDTKADAALRATLPAGRSGLQDSPGTAKATRPTGEALMADLKSKALETIRRNREAAAGTPL